MIPATGRKPADKPVRHRVKPVHEWTEVEGVPYSGGPPLPKVEPGSRSWPNQTKLWWKSVSTMPHCVLWDESDWMFALDTLLVAAAFHGGNMRVATELRNREKVLGTTLDFRRDLRIRYVETQPNELPPSVKAIEKYRKMVESE